MQLTTSGESFKVVADVSSRAKADVVVIRRDSDRPVASASYVLADQSAQQELVDQVGGDEHEQAELARMLIHIAAQRVLQAGMDPAKPTDIQGTALTFPDPEPWPRPVDGAELFDEIATSLSRFVFLPDAAADAIALWIVHTYVTEVAAVFPVLAITSPEKRCGKSRLLAVLRALVYRPLAAANVSPAAIYRVIELYRPTLLLDEADTWFQDKDELRGLINAGYERDQSVIRIVGEDQQARAFRVYGPKAIAAIGNLPDTIQDRAIMIGMRRRTSTEPIERWTRASKMAVEPIRRRLVRWSQDVIERLAQLAPEAPEGLDDRAADSWRELLSIASAGGGAWPERARRAAELLSINGADDKETSPPTELLADIRDLFVETGKTKLASQDIVTRLNARDGRPWHAYGRGKGISAHRVATFLHRFGVKPKKIWLGSTDGRPLQGYEFDAFTDAFDRYLPAKPEGAEGLSGEAIIGHGPAGAGPAEPSDRDADVSDELTLDLPDLPPQSREWDGWGSESA